MPTPSVTLLAPPPTTYPAPGILRPNALVAWTDGTGPFNVIHEWDTVATFDSGDLIQDTNNGVTSPNTGTPPSDLGPAGTTWHYRARVVDTSDATEGIGGPVALTFVDPTDHARHVYALANVGVAFDPTDVDADSPGPADPDTAADGFTHEFPRHVYALANVGVGFDPTDTPPEGWDPEATGDPLIGPGDGYTPSFDRYLYALANITNTTPTPHIWYVFPNFGREGWEFAVVGYGFGDTQPALSGSVTLNGLAVGILAWQLVAQSSPDLTIDPVTDVAEPIHQRITATVPTGATSGLVIVCTEDGL